MHLLNFLLKTSSANVNCQEKIEVAAVNLDFTEMQKNDIMKN